MILTRLKEKCWPLEQLVVALPLKPMWEISFQLYGRMHRYRIYGNNISAVWFVSRWESRLQEAAYHRYLYIQKHWPDFHQIKEKDAVQRERERERERERDFGTRHMTTFPDTWKGVNRLITFYCCCFWWIKVNSRKFHPIVMCGF